mgnify:CR=1 FL=1
MSAPTEDFTDQPIDLSAYNEDYARAEVRAPDPSSSSVPDGFYDVRIEEARLSRTARTNNPMIVWRLRILGPSHEGAVLSKTRVITQKTLPFLKQDLELLGLQLDRLSDLALHLDATAGQTLRISKKLSANGWTDIYFLKPMASAAAAGDGFPEGIEDTLPF